MNGKFQINSFTYIILIISIGVVISLLGLVSIKDSLYDSSKLQINKVINGSWAKLFESKFDKNLNHYPFSKSFWSSFSYFLFKEGKEGVLIGKDGWLFTTEEFSYSDDFNENIENNLNYISFVKTKLLQNNIKLFVVPIPSKARVLENKLGKYNFPKYRIPIYGDFLKYLNDNKIPFLDILSKVKNDNEFFLKTDTHWSPYGARIVANELKKEIGSLITNKQNYNLLFGKIEGIEGDLMRYTINGKVANILGFKGDYIRSVNIDNNLNDDDLFGDETIPVTLVGTSYSANKNWGFESFLKNSLGVDILNMSDEGLGPFKVMKSYLKSNEFKSMKPELIIWEIPERYIPMSENR